MALSENEEKVLALISQDPFLSQRSIADQLALNRSTVATIVASLTNKRYLQGRAYVVNPPADIFCIGGMNVDRIYHLKENFVKGTSNPVMSTVTAGGVARNIAENLGRLGQSVNLLSLAGSDGDYEMIRRNTQFYVNLDHVEQLSHANTSAYTAVLDAHGEMEFAFADMEICNLMSVDWINRYKDVLKMAKMLVVDLNLPADAVAVLIAFARVQKIPLTIIPVSGPKMAHLPSDLTGVNWLIVNQDESETFFNLTVKTEEDFINLGRKWLEAGVENIIITRGMKASLYINKEAFHLLEPPQNPNVVDVTGAGDSYAAGLIYGQVMGYTPLECLSFAMTNAYHTISAPTTVRKNLAAATLQEETNKLREQKLLPHFK